MQSLQIAISTYIMPPHIQNILSTQLFSAKHLELIDHVLKRENFKNVRSQIKSWFLKRAYPEKLIENEMRKVKFCNEGIKKAKRVKTIPFVVSYHSQLKKSRKNNKSKDLLIKYE